jgi:hypothetical protein
VFIGIGSLTGLSSNAYPIPPISLPAYPTPKFGDFLWTIALSALVAVVTFAIVEIGRRTGHVVAPGEVVLTGAAFLLIGGLAIVFSQVTGQSTGAVLSSGQDAMNTLVKGASTISLGTLALLIARKAWRGGSLWAAPAGGPTLPAIFLGPAGGLSAAHLPGFAETPAVGVLVGAMVASVLKLPLSAIVIRCW